MMAMRRRLIWEHHHKVQNDSYFLYNEFFPIYNQQR